MYMYMKKTRHWVWLVCMVLPFFLASCATQPKSKVRGTSSYTVRGETYYPMQTGEGYVEEGEASWYGPGFHGKTTANGERYNQNAMTAAHKTLPLGTDVRVTHLENGKSIEVRINDRGPFLHGRIIDLSKRGAEKLGMKDAGTGLVRVEALSENGVPFASGAVQDDIYNDGGELSQNASDAQSDEYDQYEDEYSEDYAEDYEGEYSSDYEEAYEGESYESDDSWSSGPKRKKVTLSDGVGGAQHKKTLF